MASKTQLWNKAGRFLTATVVVCFFLPFFGISCQGMEIVRFSGADMVGGCKPGGMITEADKQLGGMGGGGEDGGKVKSDIPDVERKPLAMVAMGAAILACGLAWAMRGKRQALIATFALALIGTGAMVGLYVTITAELTDTAKNPDGKKDQPTDEDSELARAAEKEMEKIDVDAGARFGFWLTSLGFLAILGITGMALREKDGDAAAGYTAPPPG